MRKEQFKTFITTFLITAIVLGCFISIPLFAISKNPTEQTPSTISSYEYAPIYEHEQNILIICCDWRGGSAELFALLKINPVKQKFNLAVLPLTTVSTVNIRTDTLLGHYDYGGSLMAVEAAQNACDIKINRYIRFSRDNLSQIIDSLGGVEFNVKEGTDEISNGLQTLDTRRIFGLISSPTQPQKQSAIASDIFKKFINENLKSHLQNNLDSFFKTLTEKSDTTITAFDFEYRKQALQYILKEDAPCEAVIITGEWDEEEKYFTLSDESITDLKASFWLEGV